ncbi:hypothetical protein D8B26_004920 [Coccidioides posadasii str. Silveira]|uniref:uncharacterized protein n=1 Tax=Coccidioides posadasii (strain RMSCC 757 / Silveira) TaxID=443226 RepID=UPI001BED99A1|nr:hypothetical protein D8B26_004920 [Coccidioides posadasii str. Silveira]
MTHLKAIYSQMGTDLLREMLNYPAVLATGSGQKRARLGKPMLVFDKVGVAIGFVPTGEDQYTYHHLRTDLYGMALRSGVKMDTCYTACTAHITLDRFVSTTTFDSDSDEGTQKHIENWIRTIQCINQEVKDQCWTDEWDWVVDEERGLEIQMGMLKFGRGTNAAAAVGQSLLYEYQANYRVHI